MKKDIPGSAASSFMSIPEVQAFLGIKSRKTILKYITTGKLSAYKVGGTRWRISLADVKAFLKAEFNSIGQEAFEKYFVIPAKAGIQVLQNGSPIKDFGDDMRSKFRDDVRSKFGDDSALKGTTSK